MSFMRSCSSINSPSAAAANMQVHGENNAIAQMYALGGRICQFAAINYVIEIGGCFGARLVGHLNGAVFLGLVRESEVTYAENFDERVRLVALNSFSLPNLDEDILQQSLIIWPTIDIDLDFDPNLCVKISHWVKLAPYVIISHSGRLLSSPQEPVFYLSSDARVQHQSLFQKLLDKVDAKNFLQGYSHSDAKVSNRLMIALGGSHAVYRQSKSVSVLAIISCFNDVDVIVDIVNHLLEQGVKMHFIDNWSKDGTWEILSQLAASSPDHIVAIERYPKEHPDEHYDWHGILCRKEEIAQKSNFDWFIHYDSDELRSSCWPKITLVDALSWIDHLGYNTVNHHVIEFRPTKDGFYGGENLKTFFSHFEENNIQANANQLKTWKKQPERVMLAPSGGHLVHFSNRKIYPLCFLLAHYSLRSSKQAHRKLYVDRLPRSVKENQQRRYHGHYNRYRSEQWMNSKFIWDSEKLCRFDEGTFYSDYFLKRLTGC